MTTLKSLLIALALGATTVATASDINTIAKPTSPVTYRVAMYASASSPSLLKVNVEKEAGKQVAVNLKDAQGNTLATQMLNKKPGSYQLKFNLSELPDGTYTVETVSGEEVSSQTITLKTTPVAISRTVAIQ